MKSGPLGLSTLFKSVQWSFVVLSKAPKQLPISRY